jgi:hypothetical protein
MGKNNKGCTINSHPTHPKDGSDEPDNTQDAIENHKSGFQDPNISFPEDANLSNDEEDKPESF